MTVRISCEPYVMAGGWGGEDNGRIRTLTNETPSQQGVTLNLIYISLILLLPLTNPETVANELLQSTEC